MTRRSRAGARGTSWYGSYDVVAPGHHRSSATSLKRAKKRARDLSVEYGYATVRTDEWTGHELLAAYSNGKRVKTRGET